MGQSDCSQNQNSNLKQSVIAIDQGTFSSRAMVFAIDGSCLFHAQQSIELKRIDAQRIEQDGSEILQSVKYALNQAIEFCQTENIKILSAGLATQRSSIIAWRPSTGQPVSALLSWQDTRAADWLKSFETRQKFIQRRSGLRLSAHYGVSKMHWLMKNSPDVQQALQHNDCVITPLASFLMFHLLHLNPIVIDSVNASRSLLCNLLEQGWDNELLALFRIPPAILPACQPVQHNFGKLQSSGIELRAVNGDQNSALYSQGEPDQHSLRVNLGTGAFILAPLTMDKIASAEFECSGLLASISGGDNAQTAYSIEGTVNGAGAALDWLQQQFDSIDTRHINQQDLSHIRPAIFINSIGALGSPFWRSDIEAHFLDDFEPGQNPREALAGVLESIVFLLQINHLAIKQVKSELHSIVIGGGLSQSDYLCQKLANLSGLSVQRSSQSEATARGIAWLALENVSQWVSLPNEKVFEPSSDDSLQYRFERFCAEMPKARG
jgi:glycerol kinase